MKSLIDELRMCAGDIPIARDYVRSVCGNTADKMEQLERTLTDTSKLEYAQSKEIITLKAEIGRLRHDRGDCQIVMDGQWAKIEMLRVALQAELKFWRNQPSPYRHDERIEAIETALRH